MTLKERAMDMSIRTGWDKKYCRKILIWGMEMTLEDKAKSNRVCRENDE